MDPNFELNNPPLVHQKDDYGSAPQLPPQPKGPRLRTRPQLKYWLILLVGIIVLLVLVLIAYGGHHKTNKLSLKSKLTTSKTVKAKVLPPKTLTIPSVSYDASAFNTSLSYPKGWTVVASGLAPLTITSPPENLIADNGKSTLSQIVLTLAQQGSIPSGFSSQSVAVMTSQKIFYSQPASGQASATYISFVQYPSTTIIGGLDGIYLTGNYGYQKYQAIPASNINSIDPLIYVSFYSCANSACLAGSRQHLTIASSDWNNLNLSGPVMLMFKSFIFS